jgi:hypothetical protein
VRDDVAALVASRKRSGLSGAKGKVRGSLFHCAGTFCQSRDCTNTPDHQQCGAQACSSHEATLANVVYPFPDCVLSQVRLLMLLLNSQHWRYFPLAVQVLSTEHSQLLHGVPPPPDHISLHYGPAEVQHLPSFLLIGMGQCAICTCLTL